MYAESVGLAEVAVTDAIPGVSVVTLIGEHDRASRDRVRQTVSRELERLCVDEILVIDLTFARFIDASIIDCLVEAEEHATELGVVFRLEPGEEHLIHQALRITGALERSYRRSSPAVM